MIEAIFSPTGSGRPAKRALPLAFLVLFAFPAFAEKPSVSINFKGIDKTEKGFVIRGSAKASGPVSGHGETHIYRLSVVVDIKNSPAAKFPKLAKYMILRTPPGAQTSIGPGSGPGGLMTVEEKEGVDCLKISANPDGKTGRFEIDVPAKHAGKAIRVRAFLNYSYENIGTPWPMIRYYHDIGYTGPLQATGGDLADTGKSGTGETGPSGNGEKPGGGGHPPGAEVSDDPPIAIPDLPEAGILGTVGDPAASGQITGVKWKNAPSEEDLRHQIDLLDKQIADPNTPRNLRVAFSKIRNGLVVKLCRIQTAKIWWECAGNMTLDAADKALGYHPVTGPYWAVTKAIYQAAKGQWKDAALSATGVINKITIGGETINNVGTMISLTQDGITVAGEVLPAPRRTPPGCRKTKCNGFSQHYYK